MGQGSNADPFEKCATYFFGVRRCAWSFHHETMERLGILLRSALRVVTPRLSIYSAMDYRLFASTAYVQKNISQGERFDPRPLHLLY